jgi:hypothetical protein
MQPQPKTQIELLPEKDHEHSSQGSDTDTAEYSNYKDESTKEPMDTGDDVDDEMYTQLMDEVEPSNGEPPADEEAFADEEEQILLETEYIMNFGDEDLVEDVIAVGEEEGVFAEESEIETLNPDSGQNSGDGGGNGEGSSKIALMVRELSKKVKVKANENSQSSPNQRSDPQALINEFLRRPGTEEHKAALEAIISRPCGTPKRAISNPIGRWPSYDEKIDAKFQSFVEQETAVSGKAEGHLIKPSGTLDAPLHLLLHYPTFSTKHPSFGEVSDTTNPCLGLLVSGKGLKAVDGILFSDTSSRRKNAVNEKGMRSAYKIQLIDLINGR